MSKRKVGGGSIALSKRALFQRVKRRLLKDGEVLKTARGERAQADVGEYYTVDLHGNFIVEKDVDLEEKGRSLKVLATYERVEE